MVERTLRWNVELKQHKSVDKDTSILKGIVYTSQADVAFDRPALDELEAHAARRNRELGVTGYLYFEDGHFFQYIEGLDHIVTELMARIAADYRHTVQQTLVDDQVVGRRFPKWSMRALDRRHFIGLESLLKSHLDFMERLDGRNDESHRATAWRLIQRISDVQTQLQSA